MLDQLLTNVINHPLARELGKRLGVAEGVELRRGRVLPALPVALGSVNGGRLGAETLMALGILPVAALRDVPDSRTADPEGRLQPPRYTAGIGALVVDATHVNVIEQLEEVRQFLRPAMRGLGYCGRVVLLGVVPDLLEGVEARAAQQALTGIVRTVGKELGKGCTANLLQVGDWADARALRSSLEFLLQGRSAYVDGQPWRVFAASIPVHDQRRPFAGKIVVVTGSARGIGAEVSRTFARDGGVVVAVDVPASGESLSAVANEIGGTALQLDVTAPDAGDRIARHVADRYGAEQRSYAVVHCAGILRDKLLANTDEARWGAVLEVNLAAQIRINEVLLRQGLPGGLADNGRIVSIASTSGLAGNRGQANYAASKAGVVGMVQALQPRVAPRGITVNAVAPGFIETDMTAHIPFASREVFRRMNSLHQGGKPVDVAEAIAYLADPGSQGVSGQVLRVCGQAVVGA